MTLDEFRTSTHQYGTRYAYQGHEVKIIGQYGDGSQLSVSYDLDTVLHYNSDQFDVDVSELSILKD